MLWAETTDKQLEVSYIRRLKKGKQSVLVRSYWNIDDKDKDAAKEWCKAVMAAAYDGKPQSLMCLPG